jgi:hypothetical protein
MQSSYEGSNRCSVVTKLEPCRVYVSVFATLSRSGIL